jgi:hypothetical protein
MNPLVLCSLVVLFISTVSGGYGGYMVQREHIPTDILAGWSKNITSTTSTIYARDASAFYQLAAMLFNKHHNSGSSKHDTLREQGRSSTFNNVSTTPYKRVHLIRVPKASSTSLSVVARRLVGCQPPGPCCQYPGDPPGTCPKKHLSDCESQRKVIGCTNHFGNDIALRSSSMKSIMVIRNPISRSLSAFHYPGMHHNSDCKGEKLSCFQAYLKSRVWSNVVVKMLVGDHAYANVRTCYNSSEECSHSLQLAQQNLMKLHFVGVAELWELSMLVLHLKFPRLEPLLEEFNISPSSVIGANNITHAVEGSLTQSTKLQDSKGAMQRVNHDSGYRSFTDEARKRYMAELVRQNQLDMEIYAKVLQIMCQELIGLGLWEIPYVQDYWHNRIKDASCSAVTKETRI